MRLVKLLFAATIGVLATADMKMSPVCIATTACAGTGVTFLGVWAAKEAFRENHKNSGAVSKNAVPDSNVPSLLFGDSQVEEKSSLRWIGTAPFCDTKPSDCTNKGAEYVRSDASGDGSKCFSGEKVLCRCKLSTCIWLGAKCLERQEPTLKFVLMRRCP